MDKSIGFRRIFTVAFLLFLAPAGALTLRANYLTCENTTTPATFFSFHNPKLHCKEEPYRFGG